MTEFEAEGVLGVVLDERSLREAKRDLEDELGDVAVTVENGRATAGSGAFADGGADMLDTMVDIQQDQLTVQEDILDELEQGALGGGGGGGGGGLPTILPTGGFGGGGGGLLSRVAPFAGAAGLGLLGATLPSLLRDDVSPGGQSFAASLLATPPVQLLGLGAQGLDGIQSLFDGGDGDRATTAGETLVESVYGTDAGGDRDLAETVGSVTRRRSGDPLAGTNRFGDDEPGVDPSNVPSRGSREVVNRLGDAQPGVDRSQVPSRGSSLSGDLPGRRIPGTETVTFDQPRDLSRQQQLAILRDKNILEGEGGDDTGRRDQSVTVNVQNTFRQEFSLDDRDIERFLRDPERYIKRVLGIRGSGTGRGP